MVVLDGEVDTRKVYVGWKAIAKALGVSYSTARRWWRENGLPAYKVVGQFRVTDEELKVWMDSFRSKKSK